MLLGSLYTYCAETFVNDVELPEVPEGIDWIKELNTLLNVVDPALTIYGNIASQDGFGTEEFDILNVIFTLFDEDNPNGKENEEAFDILLNCLSNSMILDVVFK